MNLEVFKIWISFQCISLIGKSADFVLGYIGSLEPEVLCIAKRALSVSLCPDYFVSVTLGGSFFILCWCCLPLTFTLSDTRKWALVIDFDCQLEPWGS